MAVSISLSITQNSQNITNNTSNVTVKVTAHWTGGSYNHVVNAAGVAQAKGWVKIDGTSYDFDSTFNDSKTQTGSKVVCTKTVNVTHASDGKKTLNCSASYSTGVASGTVTASASKVLTTIPRKSTLAASNGTLGVQQKLTVTRQATSFTHTITYKCGTATGTICTKSSSESINWTPPMDLAKQNTSGTSVSITFTITTYSGSTSVGSNTKTISCSIPADVKPTCVVAVTDPTGVYDQYNAYVQGLSKFKVTVTPTTAYNSAIGTYKTTANGKTYTDSSFTTDLLASSGNLKVSATVTDKRGRSGSDSETITVLPYSKPSIIRLSVRRCNADGTVNEEGECVQVSFSATVSSINGRNSASYILKYKRSTEDTFTEIELDEYADIFNVTDGSCQFDADTGSSYNVELDVIDNHGNVARATTASTAYVLMHWNTAGDGMGIGKVSEMSGVLDIGMKTRLYGGLMYPTLEEETDLNDIRTPNTYVGENVSSYQYGNCPIDAGTFTLEVLSAGINGQVLQRLTRCDKMKPVVFQRYWYGNSWGSWFWAGSDEILLYENESGSNGTITLKLNNTGSETSAGHFRYLEIYFTDNNGKGGGYTKIWNPDGKTISLQITEPASTIYSRQTFYTISGQKLTPNTSTASYFRITSAGAVSTSIGTNYIKIVRVIGRA